MISYNVSVTIDAAIEEEWIYWMKNHHIPRVMNTGCFLSYEFYKLFKPADEAGLTYIIQYKAEDMSAYEGYRDSHAGELQQETLAKYGESVVAFRTLMEMVK